MLTCDHCKKTGTLRIVGDGLVYVCNDCGASSVLPDLCGDGCADHCAACCGESRNCGVCECEHHVATGLCAEHAPKPETDAAFVDLYERSDVDFEGE